jgi:hypothetical protein
LILREEVSTYEEVYEYEKIKKIIKYKNMKKRIGILRGKPIVEGDSNLVTDNEIHINNLGGGSGSGSDSGEKQDCFAVLCLSKDIENEQGLMTTMVKINLNSKKILYNNMSSDVVFKKIDYDYDGVDNVYMITIEGLKPSDLHSISCTSFKWADDYRGIVNPGLIKGSTEVTPSESTYSDSGETQVWINARFDHFVWYDYNGLTDIEEKNILFILRDPNVPI